MSGSIKVLIVDDSAFMRKAIRDMVESDPDFKVVGIARNGEDALYQFNQLKPDVVTVDLYMPDMDGVAFIREQMKRKPVPIVVISSANENAEYSLAALEAGAIEFVQKPTSRAEDTIFEIQKNLRRAIQAAGTISVDKLANVVVPEKDGFKAEPLVMVPASGRIKAVLIGISTGGPQALRALIPRFPSDFPAAIAIALHIPEGYTQAIAKRLNELSALEVVESADGMEMKPGRVILAKSGCHTRLVRRQDGVVVTELVTQALDTLYKPSVDLLFESGAEVYGNRVLGAVMTGMGNDGAHGAARIKAEGGLVFAEAASSSIIYGMPRVVTEAGLVDRVAALDEMAEVILEAL